MKRFQIEPLEERIAPSYMGGFDGSAGAADGGADGSGADGGYDASGSEIDGGHPHEGRRIDHGGVYPDGTHSEPPHGDAGQPQDPSAGTQSRSGFVHEDALDSNSEGDVRHYPEDGSNDSEVVASERGVKNH